MANIILKDKDGIPVTHNGITQLRVPGYDNKGNETTHRFTHLSGLYLYAYEPMGAGVGAKIIKKITVLTSGDVWFFGINEADFKSYGYQHTDGTIGCSYIVSTNGNLVAGNIYTTEELIGG